MARAQLEGGPILEMYMYDEPGNLLSDGTHNYQYDLENRISCVLDLAGQCSQNAIQYFYDAQGRRVGKQQGNTLEDSVYDPQGHVISVHDAAANLLRAEFYAGDRHVAAWNAGELVWNHADGLGTERARTDAAGNVVEQCLDSPFGMNLSCTSPTDASPIHLAGMEYDSETGTYHTLHRQYQVGLGRWLTADPAGKDAVHPDDPQTWNLYAYVRNNPLTLTDPTGEGISDNIRLAVWIGQALAKYVKEPPPPEPIPTPRPHAPKWKYSQSTGQMSTEILGSETKVGPPGYAGHNKGKNKPDYQGVAEDPKDPKNDNAGPLPRGKYFIGHIQTNWIHGGHTKLPASMWLTEEPGTDKLGRQGGYLIHGGDYVNQDSSQGCPVERPHVRYTIGNSGIFELEVVK